MRPQWRPQPRGGRHTLRARGPWVGETRPCTARSLEALPGQHVRWPLQPHFSGTNAFAALTRRQQLAPSWTRSWRSLEPKLARRRCCFYAPRRGLRATLQPTATSGRNRHAALGKKPRQEGKRGPAYCRATTVRAAPGLKAWRPAPWRAQQAAAKWCRDLEHTGRGAARCVLARTTSMGSAAQDELPRPVGCGASWAWMWS